MRRALLVPALLCVCAFLLAAGCGRQSKLGPIANTSGRVTLDGKPLPYGTVTFVPDREKGTTGPAGVGHIDKEGYYRIVTAREQGALVGWHLVRVVAIDRGSPEGRWLIPPEYDIAEKSGLVAEVKVGVDNTIDFDLHSKKK